MMTNTETLPTTQSGRALVYGKTGAAMNRYLSMFQAYIGGMSVVEIAQQLDCSPSTVYQALEVIEKKHLEAPDSVRLSYTLQSRRRSIREMREMVENLKAECNELRALARELKAKGAMAEWFNTQRTLTRLIDAQRKLFEQIRREDWDLSIFSGVLKNSGAEVRIVEEKTFFIDGKTHARMADLARKYREEFLGKI